ncbi:MerR family transcriptional regulator [Williamsia limnetica]|uniref:DNA polymerase III subunit beta family protein n=1 Tax=Williamsia limnetica TaxID=882452 RepID=UPI000D7BC1C2|nr:MerR family transcriptional regulator [Williamsia limnetica]
MPNSELMSIGSFARRSGLTASALRFYADVGLLPPTVVDPVSGYRFYGDVQLDRAVMLRQLREIGMPLARVKFALDTTPEEAIRLIDQHIDAVSGDAATAREQAAVMKANLSEASAAMVVCVSGPVLASAIEQVLTATTNEPGMTVLGGVRFEAGSGSVVVTATDRYRLSTRTLLTQTSPDVTWAATVNGDDLRRCLIDLRRTPRARIEGSGHGLWLRLPNRDDRYCRLLPEPFPEYRQMLDSLPSATTCVEVSKAVLLQSLEDRPAELVQLHVSGSDVTVRNALSDRGTQLEARVSGNHPIDVWFEMTTLYPAISTAIGADVLIDLRGPMQPVTIRSADHGDLTTLAMPTMSPSAESDTASKEANS